MKMARILGWALAALVTGRAWAASSTGITVSPASVTFSYQVGSATLPASSKVTVTLPTGTPSSTVVVAQASSAPAWLVVTPASGYSPLALTLTANPTGLPPGTYPGSIAISTVPATMSLTIPVNLMVSNPPSSLVVISPSPNYTPATSSTNGTLTFSYTTGAAWPAYPATDPTTSSEIDVASNGGTIPFTVTAACRIRCRNRQLFHLGSRGAAGLDAFGADHQRRSAFGFLRADHGTAGRDHRAGLAARQLWRHHHHRSDHFRQRVVYRVGEPGGFGRPALADFHLSGDDRARSVGQPIDHHQRAEFLRHFGGDHRTASRGSLRPRWHARRHAHAVGRYPTEPASAGGHHPVRLPPYYKTPQPCACS